MGSTHCPIRLLPSCVHNKRASTGARRPSRRPDERASPPPPDPSSCLFPRRASSALPIPPLTSPSSALTNPRGCASRLALACDVTRLSTIEPGRADQSIHPSLSCPRRPSQRQNFGAPAAEEHNTWKWKPRGPVVVKTSYPNPSCTGGLGGVCPLARKKLVSEARDQRRGKRATRYSSWEGARKRRPVSNNVTLRYISVAIVSTSPRSFRMESGKKAAQLGSAQGGGPSTTKQRQQTRRLISPVPQLSSHASLRLRPVRPHLLNRRQTP